MAAAVTSRTKLVFVGNPNNPTGTALSPVALEAFVRRLPPEPLVVLDEAYWEFLPEPERPRSVDWVRGGRRCFVLRTFSKVYGLAGLRIGYGVGPPEVIEAIGKTRRAFDVNTQAQVAALASMDAAAELAERRRLTAEGRAALERTL